MGQPSGKTKRSQGRQAWAPVRPAGAGKPCLSEGTEPTRQHQMRAAVPAAASVTAESMVVGRGLQWDGAQSPLPVIQSP